MRPRDILHLSFNALSEQRMRTFLTSLGIAVGIASVVLLTSLGEGVHHYVVSEFTHIGTNVVSIVPGRTMTRGAAGGSLASVQPLTLDDAVAVARIRGVEAVGPLVRGSATVKAGNRNRSSTILGVGPDLLEVWRLEIAKGRFLPDDGLDTARPFVVLGRRLYDELFADRVGLGRIVRIAGERYRVIGIMHSKGEMLGVDVDDTAFIPVVRAMAMFNRESLMEISALYGTRVDEDELMDRIRTVLSYRHGGEDFSVSTQDEMRRTLGSILSIVTLTIAGLASISLVVGGVGILTIMTISVSERTPEIGLLRAIGSKRRHVLLLFLIEAMVLSGLGGAVGLLAGIGGAWVLALAIPALPVHVSAEYAMVAAAISLLVGLAAGVAPARSAARIDPVEALRAD